jgi:hypothetical protein
VATGIGQIAQPVSLREDYAKPSVKVVQKPAHAVTAENEYARGGEKRAVGNRQKTAGDNFADRPDGNLEYLDIPAFLRRQAD